MINIKNRVFLYLTKNQKSALISYLKSFAKKYHNLGVRGVIDKFIENETYYLEIKNPHFKFIIEYLKEDNFLKDLESFLSAVFYELKRKEALKPLIEKQKRILAEKRKRCADFKMSKLKPTLKQMSYYKKLVKSRGTEMKNLKEASRLDLRNWIEELINEGEE